MPTAVFAANLTAGPKRGYDILTIDDEEEIDEHRVMLSDPASDDKEDRTQEHNPKDRNNKSKPMPDQTMSQRDEQPEELECDNDHGLDIRKITLSI
ncbi:hypothetical protein PLICRDRAFT_180520 [Plicaturopsis crispa FD-325 SS-3]|uniref:Uncharacterized protein n=1 Tax=Plicaturopsis crispa FD-325 SS-3 TaxID=944288 RepID=A0A0C9SK76_PLICR|nr:hypothetical protein PLICRDRAFT_180520 [Plicaturopsis crispa FD-325 SS-3]